MNIRRDNQVSSDELLEVFSNPVRWAETFLRNPRDKDKPLILRSYQKSVLENTRKYKNIILQQGRRCLPGYSPILMYNGEIKTISEVQVDDYVVSRDSNAQPKRRKVINKFNNGIKSVYKIRLHDGREIDCTSNHPILCWVPVFPGSKSYHYEWKTIDDGLEIGDKVTCLKDWKVFGSLSNNDQKHSYYEIPIKSIEYIGEMETFDITVDIDHNFTVNGIVTHNSGKSVTMCALTLWWAVVSPMVEVLERKRDKQKAVRVILATPYETQIKELWNIYTSLIADSPLLNSQVVRMRTSDIHSIEFSNGSKIEGYTIGISSSNKGTSLRSLSADILFIDEMDFIPREIMEEVIIPIATTHTDCRMFVCSTPSGKRELYYEWCSKASELGWYHQHIPAWHPDNDNWMSIEQAKEKGIPANESTEFQVRAVTSSERFAREYGAEFGEELGGVYKHSFINRSLVKYGRDINLENTDEFNPEFPVNRDHLYVMGVDWNSYQNGGQIVVVEYCRTPTIVTFFDDEKNEDISVDFTNKFRLFYRRGIKVQGATQRATREEIIRITSHMKIDFIYVDYGYGDTNIEELTFYGKSHPELQFDRKLRAIDAGATTEHWDPVLREKVSKRNKSLMVNFSSLYVEEGRILLPKEEDQKTRLIGQMRGYVVKNVTTRGDFAYEGEDHILDAFNLALYGFSREFDPGLFTNKQLYTMVILPDPRGELYPRRETEIVNKRANINLRNIKDPELAPVYQKPMRASMPRIGMRSNISSTRRSYV